MPYICVHTGKYLMRALSISFKRTVGTRCRHYITFFAYTQLKARCTINFVHMLDSHCTNGLPQGHTKSGDNFESLGIKIEVIGSLGTLSGH